MGIMLYNFKYIRIKKLLLSFVYLIFWASLFAGDAHCADVTLAWDKSISPVTGYNVYYGPVGRPETGGAPDVWKYAYVQSTGDVDTYTINDLGSGKWFFAVTAYNTAQESAYSNEVSTDIAAYVPPAPVIHPPVTIPVGPSTVTITTHVEVK